MHSKSQRENELRTDKNRALLSSIINVGAEKRDLSDKATGRARYASTGELVI